GFALAGDVHLWRGELAPADYSVPTPDGRPTTREFAGERLARVVCADRQMLDETDIGRIAEALWDAQVARIAERLEAVRARHPALTRAAVTGLGELRAAGPLPHSWEVTSDSIAAWLAGQLHARRVVLIKPAPADARTLVDSSFLRTLPHGVEHLIVTADDLGQLDVALREEPPLDRHTRGGRGGRGGRRAG